MDSRSIQSLATSLTSKAMNMFRESTHDNLALAGYEIMPLEKCRGALGEYASKGASEGKLPPSRVVPVFADDDGNHFTADPGEEIVASVPFIPGSPVDGNFGGFMPTSDAASGPPNDDMATMMATMMQSVPAKLSGDWVGRAAMNATLAGAPGTAVAAAMQTLVRIPKNSNLEFQLLLPVGSQPEK